MRMVMAVVPRDQASRVMEALIAAGYKATFTDSRGGMLRQDAFHRRQAAGLGSGSGHHPR